jgi:hypothetical protein
VEGGSIYGVGGGVGGDLGVYKRRLVEKIRELYFFLCLGLDPQYFLEHR